MFETIDFADAILIGLIFGLMFGLARFVFWTLATLLLCIVLTAFVSEPGATIWLANPEAKTVAVAVVFVLIIVFALRLCGAVIRGLIGTDAGNIALGMLFRDGVLWFVRLPVRVLKSALGWWR